MQSIVVSTFAALGTLITKEMQFLMNGDTLELEQAGEEKTALFVSVSDVNRSRDVIANIFFTQAMQTLVFHADHRCRDCRLPVPVRFILDDFATNVNIAEFPRMIASIRSRGISAMLIIQAESQLGAAYGEDGRTIISNCDTYPVDILMHSPGGEVNSGLMIYDVLRGMRCEVNHWCLGTCASMAAILLASGKKGHRFILPHGQVMIHEPQVLSGIGGSASSIRNLSDSILRTREITNKILAEHTGHTLAEINDATAYDHYMGAGEAVEFGICDEIRTRIGS